jgi:purine-nucleoside phosphorylase
LVVAACTGELKPFVTLGRRHFLTRGDTAFLAAGVGPVAAAFGLTHFLEDFRPRRIIGVGTAGIINQDKFRIGDVVTAKSVTTASGMSDGYVPQLQSSRISLVGSSASAEDDKVWAGDDKVWAGDDKPKNARVFAPQEISRTEARRRALLTAGLEVEHLESFAFAFVARKFRIPITIVLGLANSVGPRAHAEWKKNAADVMQKVARSAKNP